MRVSQQHCLFFLYKISCVRSNMLSIAVKNTILVVLITFILHFMILNYLSDKKKPKVPEKYTELQEEKKEAQPSCTDVLDTCVLESKIQTDSKRNEEMLYDYVFSSSAQATDACKNELPKKENTELIKPDSAKQTIDGAMLIHEYDGENPLNGASLYEGISAFDNQATFYEEFDMNLLG